MTDATAEVRVGSRVRSAAVWAAGRTILVRLGNVAVTAVVARILDPRDFGVFAVALTIHSIVASIGELGVASYLMRGDVDIDRYAPTVGTISLISSGVLAGGMVIFAEPLSAALGSRDAAGAMRVLALAVVLVGVFAVPGAELSREFRQDKQFFATMAGFVVSNVLLVVLALHGGGAMALAWSRVVSQLVTGSVMTAMVTKYYWPGFSREAARAVFRFGLPLAGANLIGYTLVNTDYALIGHTLGPIQLAIYVMAFNISSWSTSLLGPTLNVVTMPAVSRIAAQPELLRASIAKGARAVSLVAFPLVAITLASASPLIETLYGPHWKASAPILTVLAVYGGIVVICTLLANVLSGTGHTGVLALVEGIWLAVLVPSMAVGVRLFGTLGAAYAHVVVVVVLAAPVYFLLVRRATGMRISSLVGAVTPPLLASAAAALADAAVTALLPENRLLQLLVGASLGGLVYAALAAPMIRPILGRLPSRGPLGRLTRGYQHVCEGMDAVYSWRYFSREWWARRRRGEQAAAPVPEGQTGP